MTATNEDGELAAEALRQMEASGKTIAAAIVARASLKRAPDEVRPIRFEAFTIAGNYGYAANRLESGQSTIVATAYVEALERVAKAAKAYKFAVEEVADGECRSWPAGDAGTDTALSDALTALDRAKREAK